MWARLRSGVLALTMLAAGAAFAAETPQPPSPEPSPSPVEAGALGAVVELDTHPAAYIEAKATRQAIYGAIMGSLAKVNDAVAKAGLKPEGRPIAVFLTADDDGFTYRAMVPLQSVPNPAPSVPEPIKFGQTPIAKS